MEMPDLVVLVGVRETFLSDHCLEYCIAMLKLMTILWNKHLIDLLCGSLFAFLGGLRGLKQLASIF